MQKSEAGLIIRNGINTDGDFNYSHSKSHSKICDNKDDVFLYILTIMKSLLSIDTSRAWLKPTIAPVAAKWIEYHANGVKLIPSFDFGNQSVNFELIQIDTAIGSTSVPDQESMLSSFETISNDDLMVLSISDYLELKKLQSELTDDDWLKLDQFEKERLESNPDYCYSGPLALLADLRKVVLGK